MHFEILVEDVSGKIALESILQKILDPNGQDHTYRIISYKGIGRIPKNLRGATDPQKRILLDRLPKLLRGYGKSLQNFPATVVVAVDLDDDDAAIPQSGTQITYVATAAKVADALTQDVLLAPIESSVIPLPHQIRALSRAISSDRIRYLLADEVGLGKTIEAGLIMRELKLRGLVARTLIIAPKGLIMQKERHLQSGAHILHKRPQAYLLAYRGIPVRTFQRLCRDKRLA